MALRSTLRPPLGLAASSSKPFSRPHDALGTARHCKAPPRADSLAGRESQDRRLEIQPEATCWASQSLKAPDPPRKERFQVPTRTPRPLFPRPRPPKPWANGSNASRSVPAVCRRKAFTTLSCSSREIFSSSTRPRLRRGAKRLPAASEGLPEGVQLLRGAPLRILTGLGVYRS